MRLMVMMGVALGALSSTAAQAQPPQALATAKEPGCLLLAVRSDKGAREGAVDFDRGLARAAGRLCSATSRDADLAAATPGDIVARCPARVSSRCLAEAASKTGAGRTVTGSIEGTSGGYTVNLKVIDAESAEVFALRTVRLTAARGDEVDMEIAGECLGLDLLYSSEGRDGGLDQAPCDQRVFASSSADRARLADELQANEDDLWLTVLPDPQDLQSYHEKNGVLAGAFASALAIGVVGLATATLLGIQTWVTQGDAAELARAHPQAFAVSGDHVTVVDELDPAMSRYRELESRGRLEGFASLSSAFVAAIAGVTAASLYLSADIPGRYDAYLGSTIFGDVETGDESAPPR